MLFGLYFYSFHPCVWWQVCPSHLPQLGTQQTNLSNTVQIFSSGCKIRILAAIKNFKGLVYIKNMKIIVVHFRLHQ